jgi:DEAD/DEAH box helicase domain-containing protein
MKGKFQQRFTKVLDERDEIDRFIDDVRNSNGFSTQISHHTTIPPKNPRFGRPSTPLPKPLAGALRAMSIERLYHHQVQAIDAIEAGHDVLVATPTASGKSLIYNIPVAKMLLERKGGHALYLFPLKALARDQQRVIAQLAANMSPHWRNEAVAGVYDGDTSALQRRRLRENPPPVLISTPDMIHAGILAHHQLWRSFMTGLRYVVLDEVHGYRGLFGSHIAWVLRRLLRLARHYGADPRFIMLSATIGNPAQMGEKLISRPVRVITTSGAAAGAKHVLFINPMENPAYSVCTLVQQAMAQRIRTIVFSKSRKLTELISMWTKKRVGTMAGRLRSYRAGFTPAQRREIESKLADGELLAVITTSALEMGIDIGHLDLCILVGYPGSIMATWQRGGRVGRRQTTSAIIMVAGEDALDQYFMRHPDNFFKRRPEHGALNPENGAIMAQHLLCAAAETPLSRDEPLVSKNPAVIRTLRELTASKLLVAPNKDKRWFNPETYPHKDIDLRGGGRLFSIIDGASGEIIGEIEYGRALKETHPGAVYLHQAVTLLVNKLDLEAGEVVVNQSRLPHYTRPTIDKHTEIIERLDDAEVLGTMASYGRVRVREKVTGFQQVEIRGGTVIAQKALDLPEREIETEGMWITISAPHQEEIEKRRMHFMGAIHGLEHAMIGMMPLIVLCDRNDIGGICYPSHDQTQAATIFIYDGFQGGAGLCREAFARLSELLTHTGETVAGCACDHGCPSCVHSPKCGSGNRPIDKQATALLLNLIGC